MKNISNLKFSLASSLDKLSENFIAEFRMFKELQIIEKNMDNQGKD